MTNDKKLMLLAGVLALSVLTGCSSASAASATSSTTVQKSICPHSRVSPPFSQAGRGGGGFWLSLCGAAFSHMVPTSFYQIVCRRGAK